MSLPILSSGIGSAIASVNYAPPEIPHGDPIKDLIELVDQVEQLEIPVTHRFYAEKHEYWREITIPSMATLVGHIHRQDHINIVLSGHALVMCNGITREVRSPAIFLCQAGAQKAFQVFEDFRLVTIHSNPENLTDVRAIEDLIFELPEDLKESGMTVDEHRMSKNEKLLK